MFESIPGNDAVKKQLTHMVETSTMGQALLFAGSSDPSLPLALARHLLQSTKQNPSDLHHYLPEGKIGMHSIDSMRSFCEEVYLAPLESEWKVFLIEDADRMLTYSANALLKTLEEPAPQTLILLTTAHPDKLLPTIRSRCRTVRMTADAPAQNNRMLDILSRPKWRTWGELSESAALLAKEIEEGMEALKETLMPDSKEYTAVQRQALEKELDGAVAMYQSQKTGEMFHTLLSWFRDIELIHARGNLKLLFNPDRTDALRQSERIPLALAFQAVTDAKIALERSTPLTQTFENLFLKLNKL